MRIIVALRSVLLPVALCSSSGLLAPSPSRLPLDSVGSLVAPLGSLAPPGSSVAPLDYL